MADGVCLSSLEAKSNSVYLCYRRRERGELGPAICDIDVIYKGKVARHFTAMPQNSLCVIFQLSPA